MKRLALLLILFAVPAQAWTRKPLFQVVPGSPFTGGGGGGSSTPSYPLLAPDGSKTAPSYSFASTPGSGIYHDPFAPGYTILKGPPASGTDTAGQNTEIWAGFSTGTGIGGQLNLLVTPPAIASSATLNTAQNVFSSNAGTGQVIVGGLVIPGAPSNTSILGVFRRSGVTDGTGGGVVLSAGSGTGTGSGGDIVMNVYPPSTTGSTNNTLRQAFGITASSGAVAIGQVPVLGVAGSSSFIGASAASTDTAGGPLLLAGGAGTAGNANGGDVTLNGGAKTGSGVVGSINIGTTQTGTNLKLDRTITGGGTTGNQTINKMAGTVNFAAAATAITVTNALATTSSIIFTTMRTADTTCTFVKSVVPGAGSFVITVNVGCAAETSVGFLVTN